MTVICRVDISLFKYTKYLFKVDYVLPLLLNTIFNSTNLRLGNLKPIEETRRSDFFREFSIQKKPNLSIGLLHSLFCNALCSSFFYRIHCKSNSDDHDSD